MIRSICDEASGMALYASSVNDRDSESSEFLSSVDLLRYLKSLVLTCSTDELGVIADDIEALSGIMAHSELDEVDTLNLANVPIVVPKSLPSDSPSGTVIQTEDAAMRVELAARFKHHPRGSAQYAKARDTLAIDITSRAHDLALFIGESTKRSREQELALRKLEESVQWAMAAVYCTRLL